MLNENLSAKRVWTSKYKNTHVFIVEVEDKDTHETYLLSAGNWECLNGEQYFAVLGQGKEPAEGFFGRLDYDHKTIKFSKVSLYAKHALALTEDGKLYGWGSNERNNLGLGSEVEWVYSPTLIPFFADAKFKLLDVYAGFDHSFVRVEETLPDGSVVKRYYQIGEIKDNEEF